MRVQCKIEEVSLEGDGDYDVDGVCVTCSKCGASEEAFGTSPGSVKRCFVLLRESCGEENFYCLSPEDTRDYL